MDKTGRVATAMAVTPVTASADGLDDFINELNERQKQQAIQNLVTFS